MMQEYKNTYQDHMKKHEKAAGLRHIRLHNLRHSHSCPLKGLTQSFLIPAQLQKELAAFPFDIG